jgi:predicted deacetylase
MTKRTRQIILIFRYDDPSAISNTVLESRLLALFERYGVPVTFGVIPFVCDGDIHDTGRQGFLEFPADKAQLFKDYIDKGCLEIALHGHSHQNHSGAPAGQYSEFANLNSNEQCRRIREGRALLEELFGTTVTTFIPPWNQFDKHTVEALLDNGFETLSAAGYSRVDAKYGAMNIVPSTCLLSALEEAVEEARGWSRYHPVINVRMHDYDFSESNDQRSSVSLTQLERLLTWINNQDDLRTSTYSQTPSLPAQSHCWLARYVRRSRFLPKFLRLQSPHFVTLCMDGVFKIRQSFVLRFVGFYAVAVFLPLFVFLFLAYRVLHG